MKIQTIMRPLAILAIAVGVGLGTACEELLEVTNPGAVTEEALGAEEALPVLVDGAFGDLQDAYDEFVQFGGLFTDELTHSGSFPSFAQIDDQAIVDTNVEMLDVFTELSTTRFSADAAAEQIRATLDDAESSPLLAEALAYGAYARLFLAEMFCEITIAGGPIQTPNQVFEAAEAMFTDALQVAQAAGDDDLTNLALVGRARARLNLGDLAGAAADADQVPADFEFFVEFADGSSTREDNELVVFTVSRREMSIGMPFWNTEGIPQCSLNPNAAPPTLPDCPVTVEGPLGPDNETPLFVQLKYPEEGSDIRLASGEEASFISREASGEDVDREKAVALYLEGQRMGDLRRRGTIDPTGPGPDTCFPLPERERDTNENI